MDSNGIFRRFLRISAAFGLAIQSLAAQNPDGRSAGLLKSKPYPSTSLGAISGELGYPGEGIPPLLVVATQIPSGQTFSVDFRGYYGVNTNRSQMRYRIPSLPPGDYTICVYPKDSDLTPTSLGHLTQFVFCSQVKGNIPAQHCKDHTPIVVPVEPGREITNADPTDFYFDIDGAKLPYNAEIMARVRKQAAEDERKAFLKSPAYQRLGPEFVSAATVLRAKISIHNRMNRELRSTISPKRAQAIAASIQSFFNREYKPAIDRFTSTMENFRKWHPDTFLDFADRHATIKELLTRKWDYLP